MTPPPPDNSDPRDYVLDLSSAPGSTSAPLENRNSKIENLKTNYLSIYFKCCGVYAPIYKNKSATAYAGHCPRCRRPATIPISPTGTRSRIFQAE